jgi:PHD/YefM family antitoxin component YafN of YafNO toxin-antitoxin module
VVEGEFLEVCSKTFLWYKPNNMISVESSTNILPLMHQVAQAHTPLLLTSTEGNAVLLSEEDWRAVQETLHLLSVPGMRESLEEGIKTPLADCSKTLPW